MEQSLISYPFLFGLVAAILHVFSGPDHLAAVGPIALDNKLKSWVVGFSWGMGHVAGMLTIGVLFIFFKDYIPVELISKNSEKIVGVMLIMIGAWAFYRIWKTNHKNSHSHHHLHQSADGKTYIHKHEHNHESSKFHQHTHSEAKTQTYFTVFGIGVIHGLAGVSHFLGILPTLAFGTKFESAMYLTGFSAGTILAMVLFSVSMGLIANLAVESKKKSISNWINGVAGFAAVFVGFFWLLYN